jgi:hypothetical protein
MTNYQEPSICPKCGKHFTCSKSGKCWCYEVYLPLDKLEEIENLYDSCLCPSCLNKYAGPPRTREGKFKRSQFVYTKKQKPV